MPFTEAQTQALAAKLSAKHVRTRQSDGRTLSYIEGWHAIAEANRIFGFDAWDRHTMAIKCVWEGSWRGRYACWVANDQAISWVVLSAEGEVISSHRDPVDFCAALRQALEASETVERLKGVWSRNAASIEMLRINLPDLKSEGEAHYADVLTSLYRKCLRELRRPAGFEGPGGSSVAQTAPAQTRQPVEKAALKIGAPPRVRDREHLAFVAARNCLVCGRYPSQAHHIRFAQPRALGRKVSDEFAVPLCATHHRALHDVGDEETWWREQKIDPIQEARRLWEVSRRLRTGGLAPDVALTRAGSRG